MSLGVIFPGFSRKLALDPRIHRRALGSSPLAIMVKKEDRTFLSLLVTHFLRTVKRSVMNSGRKPEGP
eukprot:4693276-Heterocapsa_arctica.AAC.1